ncbi:MAG: hypothetical protein Q8R55_02050 [Candidatus Taylorbacteria bacterium]|nr:hypothetical protein [Candidatus Taylorbacteria bacterium]
MKSYTKFKKQLLGDKHIKKAYEDFLVWQKRAKSARTFKPTPSDSQALKRGRKNLERNISS